MKRISVDVSNDEVSTLLKSAKVWRDGILSVDTKLS